MRVLLIVLDVLGALAVLFMGEVLIRVHEVHSYSTFVELRDRRMLADHLYENGVPGGPVTREGGDEVLALLQAIGSVKQHTRIISLSAAGLLLVNALYLCLPARNLPRDRESPVVRTPPS